MPDPGRPIASSALAHRLDSWKEIASYLKRTERTVRRWEKIEALPVHRLHHDKRSSVYAYASELDRWLQSRGPIEPSSSDAPDEPAAAHVEGAGTRLSARSLIVAIAIASVATAAAGGAAYRWSHRDRRQSTAEVARDVRRADFESPGRVQILSSIKYSEDAIRLDPKHAPAWAQLGVAHVALAWFGETAATQTMGEAQREAREALRLDPELSEGWRVLGWTSHYLDWNQKTAERQFQKAIELDVRNQGALFWYSEFLIDLRRPDEALTYSRRAQEVAPRWLMPIVGVGNSYYTSGHIDLAIREYERALELDPNFGIAVHFLGLAHVAQNRHAQGIDELRKANELLGRVPVSVGSLGYALGVTGNRKEAESMLNDLVRRRQDGYYPAFPIAQIELGLGRIDAALDWLERAADERHVGYYFPLGDPIYDPVRTHPRFARLMARIVPG